MVFSQSNLCYKPKNRHIIAINSTLCFVSDLLQIVYWKIFCHSHWPLCIALQWFQQKKFLLQFYCKSLQFPSKSKFLLCLPWKELIRKAVFENLHLTSTSTKAGSDMPKAFCATHLYVPAVLRVTGLIVISLSGLKMPLTPSFSHQTFAGGLLSDIHLIVTESFSSSRFVNVVDSVTTYGGSGKEMVVMKWGLHVLCRTGTKIF